MTRRKHDLSWMALVAGLICFLVFSRALTCDFVNFDDPYYIYENPAIRLFDLRFVREAFTTSYMGWWMPLNWISLAVDYAFWGMKPLGFHLTNVLLHTVNTALVVLIAARLFPADGHPWRRYLPFFAALLWGLHPLRVESVAWVTERKDVLNGLFSLGSILFYLSYVSVSQSKRRRTCHYLVALACFLLSLMAKPSGVLFPAIYLVLDWYPLKRLQSVQPRLLLLEKMPFLAISAGVAVATLLTAAGDSILVPLGDYPLWSRVLVAGHALVAYVASTVWPSGLTHLYPIRPELPPVYYLYSLIAMGITIYSVYSRKQRPWLLASWASFVLALLPVLGLMQNGSQSHADRFTYLPAILPTVIVAGVVGEGAAWIDGRYRSWMFGLLLGLLTVSSVLSVHQIGFWRNSYTLWTRLIEIAPMGRAYYYRGDYLTSKGDFSGAAADFAVAAEMAVAAGNPESFNLYALRGEALSKVGRFAEAVEAFTAAININPSRNYFYHRGVALRNLGRTSDAARDFVAAGGDSSPIQWRKPQ